MRILESNTWIKTSPMFQYLLMYSSDLKLSEAIFLNQALVVGSHLKPSFLSSSFTEKQLNTLIRTW